MFILDESGSIYGPDFNKQLNFVSNVVSEFEVSADATRVGVMTFGDDPYVHFNLGEKESFVDVQEALNRIGQRRGQTHTAEAIRVMRSQMFSPQYARANVPHICILVTDGGSSIPQDTKMEAERARNQVKIKNTRSECNLRFA